MLSYLLIFHFEYIIVFSIKKIRTSGYIQVNLDKSLLKRSLFQRKFCAEMIS